MSEGNNLTVDNMTKYFQLTCKHDIRFVGDATYKCIKCGKRQQLKRIDDAE